MRDHGSARRGACLLVALALGLTAILIATAPAVAQPIVPHIDSLFPTSGAVGAIVFISGTNFGTQGPFSKVYFNGVAATPLLWLNAAITVQVPDNATTGEVVVETVAGVSNGVNFTVTSAPTPASTWYLAEGSTNYGFETFILMENTTSVDATVTVVYNTSQYGRLPRPLPINVPPNSRVTLNLNDDLRLPLDVSTELQSSQPIVCERAMYWNNRIEGTESIGVTQASKTWYLAEGTTLWPYETWILIQNPNIASPANVDITYMTDKGVIPKGTIQVAAGQRVSIDVSKDVGACNVSTQVASDQNIVCERSMYWDSRRGGHNSIGVTQGSQNWYLAEGSTAWGFDTWLLLQNPTANPARVDVTYMTSDGPSKQPTMTMPPNSRETVHVNDVVTNSDTSIAVSSDRQIIAERAMYWNNGTGRAGHETVGVTAPATAWYLAEGSTAWGFETFVCIQNPNTAPALVTVTYLTNNGPVDGGQQAVPPKSRVTINVNDELPGVDASIKLTCPLQIMAERAMYWSSRGGGHCSIGWAAPD
jgi:hypothetical protein